MGLAGKQVAFTNLIEVVVSGPTAKLNNLPTLVVSRSTAEPATKTISLTGDIQAVNFIAGVNAILQSGTLVIYLVYLFVNTQPGLVTLSLDSGGTIGGQKVYTLAFGAPKEFQFDGVNLN